VSVIGPVDKPGVIQLEGRKTLIECHRLQRSWTLAIFGTGIGPPPIGNGDWFAGAGIDLLLNCEPITAHLRYAEKAGFQVVLLKPDYDRHGLNFQSGSPGLRLSMSKMRKHAELFLILQKPVAVW